MDRRCSNCGGPMPPIEVAEAGPLALKLADSLVCDDCATPQVEDGSVLMQERRLRSGIPAGLVSRPSVLAEEVSITAVEVAMSWSEGEFTLLSLFGRNGYLPDRLAATAAMKRIEHGGVRWRPAGDPEERTAALDEKGTGAAVVLADVDQATLLKPALAQVLALITHRQAQGLPLMVTSSISQEDLARKAGDALLFRLRKFGKAVHVDPRQES